MIYARLENKTVFLRIIYLDLLSKLVLAKKY